MFTKTPSLFSLRAFLLSCFLLVSLNGMSQFVVTDFYNGIINTISQTIQAASKIISSEEFKHVVKVYEKLKEVKSGVQQFQRIQETVKSIQSTARYYKLALDVVAGDKHFSVQEIASFYRTLEKLAKQDARLLDDLQKGIQSNILEMSSAERMEFIMKIHADAGASAARIKGFVTGLESLSLRRCYTTNDRLGTMKLYSASREVLMASVTGGVDFGNYTETDVDIDALDEQGRSKVLDVRQQEMDWLKDPTNPQARETAMRNLVDNPMPQPPNKPGQFANGEKWARYNQLSATYQERLEYWRNEHEDDLGILGGDVANFVMEKPSELSEQEWMQVLLNKLRKGQL